MFTVAAQGNLKRAEEYFDEHLSVNDYYTADELRPNLMYQVHLGSVGIWQTRGRE